MKILEMSQAERPREKLLDKGAGALGDAELLAILLRSGRRGESAIDMAHRLLSLVRGRLSGLFDCDPGYLAGMEGIGPSRASCLCAAFELGRRFMLERAGGGTPLSNAKEVYKRILPRLKAKGHEECWVILLDSRMMEIDSIRMTTGGRQGTIIDKSMVIRKAIEYGAASLILIHNHPGGDPRPSRSDIKETGQLRDACTACNLSLLDHIIVSDEHFYSFNEEKVY